MFQNGVNISFYSFIAKATVFLCGPLTLLLISHKLSTEEIAFYYTFFNLIALQQLVELGLGFTLKQCISHAYKIENDVWLYDSKKIVKSYIQFGLYWFIGVSCIIIFVIGPLGLIYYGDYEGSIKWQGAWLGTIGVLAFSIILVPIQIAIEATQNQIAIYRCQVIYSLTNSLSLWVFIYNDFKLYSIPLSMLIANIFLLIALKNHYIKLYNKLAFVKEMDKFWTIFSKLWPLFSRVAIVWGVGFLLWNGFNLISFKIFSPEEAGRIIFSITLARAGFTIAESIISAQTTVVSNMISKGENTEAAKYYRKYQLISFAVLIIGYGFYYVVKYFFSDFYLFDKLMPNSFITSVFVFFVLLLILTTKCNFIRCYKIEPFVKVSVWHSLGVPMSFLLSSLYFPMYLYPCSFVLFISIIWSQLISKRILSKIG